MSDPDEPKIKEAPEPAPLSMAPAKRAQKVTKLSQRVQAMERALDIVLSDYEQVFCSYVAYYRLRHGCDPDTSEVPMDYLDSILS